MHISKLLLMTHLEVSQIKSCLNAFGCALKTVQKFGIFFVLLLLSFFPFFNVIANFDSG